MSTKQIPPQIMRLAILTVVIIVLYFVARLFLVPHSFGQYGWFRGDVLQEYTKLPITYAGAAACAKCHLKHVDEKTQWGHKLISCESCHGPQLEHVTVETKAEALKAKSGPALTEKEEKVLEEERAKARPPRLATERASCLRCHEASPSRPQKFPQVNGAGHNPDQRCGECHEHHPNLRLPKPTTPQEAEMPPTTSEPKAPESK